MITRIEVSCMYIKNKSSFSHTERSEEIKELAQGFRAAVEFGTVFKVENDGYALSSRFRDMDIPTSTAPSSIEGSMAILVHDTKETEPTLYMANNLSSALASIRMAEDFLESGRSPLNAIETKSVLAEVKQALPGLTQLTNSMKNGM